MQMEEETCAHNCTNWHTCHKSLVLLSNDKKRANVAMCIGAISVKKQASLGLRSHLLFDVFAGRNVFYSIIDIY